MWRRCIVSGALLLSYAVNTAYAQYSCVTVTTEVIVPTSTATWYTSYVVETTATTAEYLGTWTDVTRILTTTTLKTLSSVSTDCTATGVTQTRLPTVTVYTKAPARRDDQTISSQCTVTSTFVTTVGGTYTFLPNNKTTTRTVYTAFTQDTVTSTRYGGWSWTIDTSTTTTCKACGPTVYDTAATVTATTIQDARCAATALVSAAGNYNGGAGFGLEFMDDVPYGGASFWTTASDASNCCQLCVEQSGCAASAWDIRSNNCRLHFSANYESGALDCGEGALAFYDAGPDHPMAPGTGWYMAQVCGSVSYANAPPDDGT